MDLWPSFTSLNAFRIHPCFNVYQRFIPFYCQVMFHCYRLNTFSLFIPQLIGIWAVYTLELLGIMLAWPSMYRFLYGYVCHFSGTCLAVGWLGHMVTVCLSFWWTITLFRSCCTILPPHLQCRRVPVSPHPCLFCPFSWLNYSHHFYYGHPSGWEVVRLPIFLCNLFLF